MSNPPEHYVRYSDDVEVKQPEEDRLIRETLDSIARMGQKVFDKHRHAMRGAHAKGHGGLKGELKIYDNLPAPLAQGLFREPRTYPVMIRFSTAPGDVMPDGMSSFRGMAIKVIGVEGSKLFSAEPEALTQDFLMINRPVFPAGNVARYLNEQLLQEKVVVSAPEEAQQLLTTALRTVNAVTEKVGIDLYPTALGITLPETHILGETYYTTAALRYGDYIAKISADPLSASLQPLVGKTVDTSAPSVLRDLIVEFFRQQSAEYELRVQLCTNLETMPIEDASIQWSEEDSPYQAIAKLTIPVQEAYSPARRVYVDEVLSFNAWHCIAEHRPLGSIQRVRMQVYEASSRFRHEMNQQPKVEPRSIEEMPD
ncbi:catalase family protein [Oculatella sp. LEGE 06141]|uniref:catalase family protein n=1 Tax=Oculatella sp. LEGE 06141 TaxID=1828648 RepID=UPI0018813BD6|nr:catalase family protein [Oculatella sp. LEGE 06141]MBE9180014.1 catalase family protein [Oculatella sp. LEGE 06141]